MGGIDMKTEWNCSWQYIPGCEKHTESFPTLDAARQAMTKVLADAVDLSSYLQVLRKEEGEDCGSSADFLEKFLSNLTMTETESELPDCSDIPDYCLFEFDSCDGFRWSYMRGECPYLSAGHVYEGKEIEPYVIAFNLGRNVQCDITGRLLPTPLPQHCCHLSTNRAIGEIVERGRKARMPRTVGYCESPSVLT